jgi:hypothetical protein
MILKKRRTDCGQIVTGFQPEIQNVRKNKWFTAIFAHNKSGTGENGRKKWLQKQEGERCFSEPAVFKW